MDTEKELERQQPTPDAPPAEDAVPETPAGAPAERVIEVAEIADGLPAEKPKKKKEKKKKGSEEPAQPKEKKSRRVWKIVLLAFLSLLLIAAAVILTLDGRHVQFRMVGSAEMTVPYGEPFEEPGCGAVTMGKIFGIGKLRFPVTVSGTVDTGEVGTYELTYSARFLFDTYTTKRIVHVTDQAPPEITLLTREDYAPDWFSGYEEEGFTAWDNRDGDLTEQVERLELEGRIEYRVRDASGNEATAVRELPDMAPPELTLLGGTDLTISARMDYEDPGFTAVDSKGQDVSELVTVEGSVTPYQPGTYEVLYWLGNQAGERVSATRTVVVEPVPVPETVQPDEYTIYLTFDDGPGPYTEALLDLLARYGVKATFFVTCEYPKYEDMVGRAYREGHSIGVHCAIHDYYTIYASEQAYFDDFTAAEEMIYRQTGEYARIFRFPGGSSNKVSRFNRGIMSRLTVSMRDMGYQYFDWNVDSGDAGGTKTADGVFENVVEGCTGRRASVVLQHDVKDYSVAAVERIIIWGLRNGYTFRALDLSSPPAHHGLNN